MDKVIGIAVLVAVVAAGTVLALGLAAMLLIGTSYAFASGSLPLIFMMIFMDALVIFLTGLLILDRI